MNIKKIMFLSLFMVNMFSLSSELTHNKEVLDTCKEVLDTCYEYNKSFLEQVFSPQLTSIIDFPKFFVTVLPIGASCLFSLKDQGLLKNPQFFNFVALTTLPILSRSIWFHYKKSQRRKKLKESEKYEIVQKTLNGETFNYSGTAKDKNGNYSFNKYVTYTDSQGVFIKQVAERVPYDKIMNFLLKITNEEHTDMFSPILRK